MKIGAHTSITPKIYNCFDYAIKDNCDCIQIFVKPPQNWAIKPIDQETIDTFKERAKQSIGLENVTAHSTYLINLATNKPENLQKSVDCLTGELQRCDALGIPYHVMHPGSHLGQGEEYAIETIAKHIEQVYEQNQFETMLLLETTAGQGSSIGHTLEQISSIIDRLSSSTASKVGVCLDTCHLFSAGFDLKNDYENNAKKIYSAFGDKIKVIHINDSKTDLNSRVDRHELIGKGFIGEDMFKLLVTDSRFKDALGVLETPAKSYLEEVTLLKSYQ